VLQQHMDLEGDESIFAAEDAILVSGGARMGRHWADKPSYANKRVDELSLKDGRAEVKYFIAPLSERGHLEGWLRDHGYVVGGTPDASRTRDRVLPSDDEPEAAPEEQRARRKHSSSKAGSSNAAVARKPREETLYNAYARELRKDASVPSKVVGEKWNELKLQGQIAWGVGNHPALAAKMARGAITSLERMSQPIPDWLSAATAATPANVVAADQNGAEHLIALRAEATSGGPSGVRTQEDAEDDIVSGLSGPVCGGLGGACQKPWKHVGLCEAPEIPRGSRRA
jgi:hypothetical protein